VNAARRCAAGRAALAVALGVLALGGCASMGTEKRLTALDAALTTYGKLLRWGEYDEAAKFVQFRDRDPLPVNFTELRNYRITTYQLVDTAFDATADEARVRVRIGFYHEDSAVLHGLEDLQTWWYSEEQQRWFLDDELPDFAAALRARR